MSGSNIAPVYAPSRDDEPRTGVNCCGVQYPSTAIAFFSFNTLWLVFGIAMAALSAWAYERHDAIAKEIPEAGIGPVLSAGILLILVSILGFIGQRFFASPSGRYILGAYAFLLSVVVILEIASAVLMFVVIGRLNNYDQDKEIRDKSIKSFVDSAYTHCCGGDRHVPSPHDGQCWIPESIGIVTAKNCSDPDEFDLALIDWMVKQLNPVAIVTLVVAIVQLVAVVLGCVAVRLGQAKQLQRQDDSFRTQGGNSAAYGQGVYGVESGGSFMQSIGGDGRAGEQGFY